MTTRIFAGDHVLTIDPSLGARVISWVVAGHELLITEGPDPVEYGMYAMAPWAGRLRGNGVEGGDGFVSLPITYGDWALHGTVLAAPATTIDITQESDHATVHAGFDVHDGWPWPMHADVTYDLDADGLTTVITLTALDHAFPAVVGWHPWFRRRLEVGESCHWSFDADVMAERGDDYLPTGHLVAADLSAGPFDDAFRVPSGIARISWPEAFTVDVSGDASWFVIYDYPEASVCVEPQSGPPDGLTSSADPVMVRPGAPWSWATRWQVRDDRPADRA